MHFMCSFEFVDW